MSAARKSAPKKRAVAKRTTKAAAKRPTKNKRTAYKSAKPKTKQKTVKPRKKATITDTFEKQTKKPFAFPTKVNLAVIPFVSSWPINPDAIAVGLARYAGTAFVIIGGMFTLLYAQAIGLPIPSAMQLAQVGGVDFPDSTTTGGNETEAGTANNPPPNPEPAVSIDVLAETGLLGEVPVVISVAQAVAVHVHAFNVDAQSHLSLGSATQSANETWEFEWNTELVPDGRYKLRTIVINEFGSYDAGDAEVYAVKNLLEDPEVTIPGTDSDGNKDDETEENNSNDPTDINTATTATGDSESENDDAATELSSFAEEDMIVRFSQKTPVSGLVSVSIETPEAVEALVVKLVNRNTGSITDLGLASAADNKTWDFDWDTTEHSDGPYAIFARAELEDQDFTSRRFTTHIENEDPDASSAESFTDEGFDAGTEDFEETEEPTSADDFEILTATKEVSGFFAIVLSAQEADFIELYAKSKQFGNDRFLGLASKQSDADWKFLWDTVAMPNGEYSLYGRARINDRLILSDSKIFTVTNKTAPPAEDSEVVATQTQIKTEVETIAPVIAEVIESESAVTEAVRQPRRTFAERTETSEIFTAEEIPEVIEVDEEQQASIAAVTQTVLEENRAAVEGQMQRLATAIRSGDEAGVERIKTAIVETRKELLETVAETVDETELLALDNALERNLIDLQLRTEQTETLIKERVGEKVRKDSDNDGITDVDEVTLYGTDPLVADSDGDGFHDGAEVLSGYDPVDASPEAEVVFESPQETGITRPDILQVTAVTPVSVTETEAAPPAAVISGRGLANSFITLYIFSNPTVVTVKTDADGNWSYRFDKEIADGEHEVYVGVTDNAGRIVAKSEPVRFTKTAEAFEPIDTGDEITVVAQVEDSNNSFVSTNMLLLIASISVAAIGLVLIVLGMHLQNRRPDTVTKLTPEAPAIV